MGCADITPPVNAWMNRSYDAVTVGCLNSAQSWSLKCNQGQWIGRPIGNCSQGIIPMHTSPTLLIPPLPYEDVDCHVPN